MRATLLFAGLLWAAAAQCAPVHHYTVRINPQLKSLSVRACFDGAAPAALVAASPHAPYFVDTGRGEDDLKRLPLDKIPRDGCMTYRVDVAGLSSISRPTRAQWLSCSATLRLMRSATALAKPSNLRVESDPLAF